MEQPPTNLPSAPRPSSLFPQAWLSPVSELCSGQQVPLPLESALSLLGIVTSALFLSLLLWRFRKLRLERLPVEADLSPSVTAERDSHSRLASAADATAAAAQGRSCARDSPSGDNAGECQRSTEEKAGGERARGDTTPSSDSFDPSISQRGYRRSRIGLALHIFLYASIFCALLLLLSLVAIETCISVEKSDMLWRDRAVSFIVVWIFVFSGLYGLQVFHTYLPWFFRLRCPLSEATSVCFAREPSPLTHRDSTTAPSDAASSLWLPKKSAGNCRDEDTTAGLDEVETEEDEDEKEVLNAEAPDSISRLVARARQEIFASALSLFFGITRVNTSKEGKDAQPFQEAVNSSWLSLVPVERVKVMTGSVPSGSMPSEANLSKDWKESDPCPVGIDQECCRVVCWQGRRHVYCPDAGRFVLSKSELPKAERTRQAVIEVINRGGISPTEAIRRLRQFGVNAVPVTLPTLAEALKGELSDVMFLFQFLLVCNSFYWRSYLASSIWALLAVYGILARVWFARKSQIKVRRLAEQGDATLVPVLRQGCCERGTFEDPLRIPAKELVPGDLVLLTPGTCVPADLVLLDGSAVVDESELTGETKPIQKLPWLSRRPTKTQRAGRQEECKERDCSSADNKDVPFSVDRPNMRKSILFAGTHVISSAGSKPSTCLRSGRIVPDSPLDSVPVGVSAPAQDGTLPSLLSPDTSPACLAVVARTGSSTARGSLLRRTLSSSLFLFKYDAQLPAVFLIMLCYAAVVIGILCKFSPNATGVAGWFYAMGTLSQLLPVWTPVLIARAQAASAQRLQQTKKILTLAPQRVAVCGKVRVVCFDKTGTLTQHGMQFAGVLATIRSSPQSCPQLLGLQTDPGRGSGPAESAGAVHGAQASVVSFEKSVRPVTAAWNWSVDSMAVSEDAGKTTRAPSLSLRAPQCLGDDRDVENDRPNDTQTLEEEMAVSSELDQNLFLIGISTCHGLTLSAPGFLLHPAELLKQFDAESKLPGHFGSGKPRGSSRLAERKDETSESGGLSVHLKDAQANDDERDETDEADVFLGSDLEKRMVHATGWRLLQMAHGEAQETSEYGEQDRPCRWMVPPQFEERVMARRDSWKRLSAAGRQDSSCHGEQSGDKVADKLFLESVRRGRRARGLDLNGSLPDSSPGDEEAVVFCKGSYESVGPLCTSGLPADFTARCNALALQGFYVLALAYKQVSAANPECLVQDSPRHEAVERHQHAKPARYRSRHKSRRGLRQPPATMQPEHSCASEPNATGTAPDGSDAPAYPPGSCIASGVALGRQNDGSRSPNVPNVSRESVESGLHFLGLILFRNELKADAAEAVRQLKQGRVRPVMITGDSVLTASCVARLCGMTAGQFPLDCASVFAGSSCRMRSQGTYALDADSGEQPPAEPLTGTAARAEPAPCSAAVPESSVRDTSSHSSPTLLVAEFKNPEDPQSGLIWRDAETPDRVFGEADVFQGLPTAGGMCDLAVTEKVIEYLASTPVSAPSVYERAPYASHIHREDTGFPYGSSRRSCLFAPSYCTSDGADIDAEERASLLESGHADGSLKHPRSYSSGGGIVPPEHRRPWAYRLLAALGFGARRRRSGDLKENGVSALSRGEGGDQVSLLDALLMRIRIFARMSPQGKRRIVLAFMRRGFVTCMCGDGGNDCAALRAAHAGLAFSTRSASVLAPFTASSLQPTAAADLLKEGRCSLATALSAYKFLVVYGVLLSFVKTVLLICGGGSCMSQAIYFLMDVAILLGLSKVMVRARPKESLRIRSPTSSLLGPTTIVSVCVMLLIDFLFIVSLYSQLRTAGLGVDVDYQAALPPQAWWMRSDTYEAASCAIWLCVQLTNTAFVFSLGGMFRDRVYRNRALIISTAVLQLFFIAVTFLPTSSISCVMRINCTDAASRAVRLPVPAWMARPAAGMPLYNPRGHNIFPLTWKVQLTILSLANATVNILMARFLFSAAFLKFLRTYTNCPGESDTLKV
ncbi:cDNA FLJ39191 fis, clone OCBBF2004669, highly similar to Homo sapiens ATPase type 13A4 (ATP13A4), mRNA,related [Neospora caninum Liverpool]|uniref:ATPase type 13A4 (ATP13A4),related n=1 Tax=Neospora caninum (strain Liverpool) TaxID=572307 RepID=F0VBT6_NEOCL|nr:cDNA FLJ39191 fis, clone OCBBF2004669, highly similar to Homo sapiens ATPase type 13A4 (ATP13A4), mRNA,related [Neospora caninum Liverpool]CBZ51070.1 cDNA FLJ39191 fis, clone OCBBF2004669, highly similar to Homo sapiens ATPase type 13A4 (ATP13A4), mRNA,related [Neospora caninum Liverpool]CEL68377.1 TPA: ATPase type 13A4 (ATP13A4),related [Neospora caninum Liverpool]|eukprot:XP_003881103.1 cDNA FLJ39191 fis, clone OCBBF2004669, highly similar to Homo sapiens ATPase type 13A4 (ATP13A4), mRNA,related [Neospora caninum Liverpool]